MIGFNEKFNEYREIFEDYSKEFFSFQKGWDEKITTAVKYSFFAGGKRIRPVLVLSCADALGVERQRVLPFALALECIHTYSLIHDDLPAMDDDNFRRGRLTVHKAFDEATAILAGDALLNLAFSVCAEQCVLFPDVKTASACKTVADNAGISGMIKGQSLDVSSERERIADENILYTIEKNKTAKMIISSLVVPAILKGKYVEMLTEFGLKLGVQFQVVDDILDVVSERSVLGKTVGKDEKNGKLTYVTLFGLEKAKLRAEQLKNDCFNYLKGIPNSDFLRDFTEYLTNRIN